MTKINQFFDEIYCINLNRRVDKWESVNRRFQKLNIFVNRWSGIDGKDFSVYQDYQKNKYEKEFSFINYPGSYAILQTYINLYEHILKNTDYEKILIFEDDVLFHKDFEKRFQTAILNLPEIWDMWFLGASQYSYDDLTIIIDETTENFYTANNTEGLFAFAVKRKLIEEILLPSLKLKLYAADTTHRIFTQNNDKYNIIVSYPFLCCHDFGFSDNYNCEIGELETYSSQWAHRKYNTTLYF